MKMVLLYSNQTILHAIINQKSKYSKQNFYHRAIHFYIPDLMDFIHENLTLFTCFTPTLVISKLNTVVQIDKRKIALSCLSVLRQFFMPSPKGKKH